MRRRTLLVLLVGLAVVGAAGVVVLWPTRPTRPTRITRENCYRIKEGMSRAEVEAILGPPGDHRTSLSETVLLTGDGDWDWQADRADYATWQPLPPGGLSFPRMSEGVWKCDSLEIHVRTDDDSGRVLYDAYAYPSRRAGSPLDNLLWRLKRQWHRWFP
jgi:hypothetical protein